VISALETHALLFVDYLFTKQFFLRQNESMQAALYARVSTRDKRQDTENQLAQLRAFGASQNWTVVHEYVDRASGKHGDREQFRRLFEDASRRKFDIVLFWSLDRFSREGVLETLHHLQRLAQYGVGYRSFTEQYLDSCGIFKDAVLSILATIAKQERIRISERVHAGLAKARKQGRIGGRPRLVISHAKVLALSQEGCTIREIADEMGVSPASIHRILKSPHYVVGDLVPS
jgi:DNA invertase Pin-like site-specific DNA recombinase